MSARSPWQCNMYNSKQRDNALYFNKMLSDFTITFPFHNISFPAHRLMMGKTSPYFEKLLYGPMAINGQEWKVNDKDIQPDIFKIVLAHCYDIQLPETSIEITLEIYKLADCYMIDSLKYECLKHVNDIISKDNMNSKLDYQNIIDWSNKYGFIDIKCEVIKGLYTTVCQYDHNRIEPELDLLSEPAMRAVYWHFSSLLLNFTLNDHTKLFSLCEKVDIFTFKESWQNPEHLLSSELLMSIFERYSCKDIQEISLLQGCISPQVVNMIDASSYVQMFYLSLIDTSHSQSIYDCLDKEDPIYDELNLHIQCNVIESKDLKIWKSMITNLYLSNVDDNYLNWAIASSISIHPAHLFFPRSSLSLESLKTLIISIASTPDIRKMIICICSCNIKKESSQEINAWAKNYYDYIQIHIVTFDTDIDGW